MPGSGNFFNELEWSEAFHYAVIYRPGHRFDTDLDRSLLTRQGLAFSKLDGRVSGSDDFCDFIQNPPTVIDFNIKCVASEVLFREMPFHLEGFVIGGLRLSALTEELALVAMYFNFHVSVAEADALVSRYRIAAFGHPEQRIFRVLN